MKINHIEHNFTKLCHAKPGDLVQLVDSMLGLTTKPILLIAKAGTGEPAKGREPQGLYADGRDLLLVDLETGLASALPHLSSRVLIYRNAEVNVGKATKEVP